MRKIFSVLILGLVLMNCSCKKEKDNYPADSLSTNADSLVKQKGNVTYNDLNKLENYLTTEESDTSKTKVVDFDCAVIVYPSNEQFDEMKKGMSEEDLATVADDNAYYQMMASDLLDSVGVKKIYNQKQFVKIIGKHKTWVLDMRKKGMPGWSMILVNTNKTPEVISSIELTKEKATRYFNKEE